MLTSTGQHLFTPAVRKREDLEPEGIHPDADPYLNGPITYRPLTEREEADRAAIGFPRHDSYTAWVDAGYTPAEIQAWFPVGKYRSLLPGDAERLIRHLWRPEDVLAIRHGETDLWLNGQNMTFSDLRIGTGAVRRIDATSRPAALALLDYLARWHDSAASLMREQRDGVLLGLITDKTMDQVQVGRVLGMSKQRIGAILRRTRSERPGWPGHA